MSRRHNFPARGSGSVLMRCDVCEREEAVNVTFNGDEDPCFAQLASEQSDWRYTHDAYVCSEACAERFWAWPE